MDKIIIKDAIFFCNIGISPKERSKKQKIFVDIELSLDTRKAAQKDDLKYTINYSDVFSLIKDIAEKKEYKLIEALANKIAEGILDKFDAKKIIVKVKKRLQNMDYAAVEITRGKNG